MFNTTETPNNSVLILISNINCTKELNIICTKPNITVDEIFNVNVSSNFVFDSNDPEDVTVVFVREDAVKKALSFVTHSRQIQSIKCCSPDGKFRLCKTLFPSHLQELLTQEHAEMGRIAPKCVILMLARTTPILASTLSLKKKFGTVFIVVNI